MFQQIVASGFGTGGFDRGFSEIDLCRLAIRAARLTLYLPTRFALIAAFCCLAELASPL